MIQLLNLKGVFISLPTDDANMYIINFVRIFTLYNLPEVSQKAIRLRLFLFSLMREATLWLDELPRGSITTWNELRTQFFDRLFLPSRMLQLKNKIYDFK